MSAIEERPRVAKISQDDHGGMVTIAAAVGLTYNLLSFFIRLYTRWAVGGRFEQDDTTLGIATVIGLGQTIVVLTGVIQGFGKSLKLLDPQHLLRLEKLAYAGDLLLIVTLCLSKCSVILLLRGFTRKVNHSKACKIILGVSATWGVASVLALALRCELSHPWLTINAHCTHLLLRWLLIAVFDMVTEAALVFMAIYLVYSLQMPWKKKAYVVSAFAFRLPIIVLAGLRLYYLAMAYKSPNPTFAAVPASILSQVEMNYSLISATIPCLKPFMRACNSGFLGGPLPRLHGSPYNSAGSYALHSLPSDRTPETNGWRDSEQKTWRPASSRPGPADPRTVVEQTPPGPRREDAESMESRGSEQLIMQHTREWIV